MSCRNHRFYESLSWQNSAIHCFLVCLCVCISMDYEDIISAGKLCCYQYLFCSTLRPLFHQRIDDENISYFNQFITLR